jgi:phosphoribosylglycinamide formyltransferase 2
MGVALASGSTVEEARERARQAASRMRIAYEG